jgi:polyisoprenyl-teichoic acid--peptidoglycan teichoic acid transferase
MSRSLWVDKAFAGVCLLLCLVTMVLNWNSPVARTLLRGERVAGLVIGSDYDDYARHSDTLMYVSYDPTSRFLDVLSVPRDTMVQIKELPFVRRVNEIFAYEFRHSGRDFDIASMAFKNYVETLLSTGADQTLKIPFFFAIDYRSFRTLIDAMGGVYVKVTEPMDYDDNWGKLHIHFKPGTYLMNGKTALEYVRFRGHNADQGRVLRQQIFIKDIVQRLKNPIVLWRFPKYAKVLLDGIHTNYSFWDLVNLFLEGRRMQWKNLRLFAVPGAPSGNLWKMNPVMTQHILSMMQKPVTQTGVLPGERTRADLEKRGAATVEVWNASNQTQAGRAVVKYLREKGFDVVVFGNFATRQQRTLVIDRSGQLRPAQAVADALRGVHPEVVSRVDLTRQVDVSVILGNDATVKEGKRWRWQ